MIYYNNYSAISWSILCIIIVSVSLPQQLSIRSTFALGYHHHHHQSLPRRQLTGNTLSSNQNAFVSKQHRPCVSFHRDASHPMIRSTLNAHKVIVVAARSATTTARNITTYTSIAYSDRYVITNESEDRTNNTLSSLLRSSLSTFVPNYSKLPPFDIEDWDVLFYDIFLIINLVISISYYVIYRYNVNYIPIAFNEGCIMSFCWIIAGLFNGSFLYSAIDGHATTTTNGRITKRQSSTKTANSDSNKNSTTVSNNIKDIDKIQQEPKETTTTGGPMGAGILAFHTFINTMNLRLIIAFVDAVIHHRMVLISDNEVLIPLEFSYGILLMILWRSLHSSYVPRM